MQRLPRQTPATHRPLAEELAHKQNALIRPQQQQVADAARIIDAQGTSSLNPNPNPKPNCNRLGRKPLTLSVWVWPII